MSSLSLNQIISVPTRITALSSTLLDLIFGSDDVDIVSARSLDVSHMSDHCLIFAILNIPKSTGRQRFIMRRNLKDIPEEQFCRSAEGLNWHLIGDFNSVDSKFAVFESLMVALRRDLLHATGRSDFTQRLALG